MAVCSLFALSMMRGASGGVELPACLPRPEGSGKIVISRVATDGARNACSLIYGALCRAAKALGYKEAWTYTLPDEPGSSLKASGFEYMGETDGRGDWSRPNIGRQRSLPVLGNVEKKRWRRVLQSSKRGRCSWVLRFLTGATSSTPAAAPEPPYPPPLS